MKVHLIGNGISPLVPQREGIKVHILPALQPDQVSTVLHIDTVPAIHSLFQNDAVIPLLRHHDLRIRHHGCSYGQQHQHRRQPLPGAPPLLPHAVTGDIQQALHGLLRSFRRLPPAGHQLLHRQVQGCRQGLQQRHIRVAQSPLPLADGLVRHMQPRRQIPLGQAQIFPLAADEIAQPLLVHVYHLALSLPYGSDFGNRPAVETSRRYFRMSL